MITYSTTKLGPYRLYGGITRGWRWSVLCFPDGEPVVRSGPPGTTYQDWPDPLSGAEEERGRPTRANILQEVAARAPE